MDKKELLEFIDLDDIAVTYENFSDMLYDKSDYDMTEKEKKLYELLDEISDVIWGDGDFETKFLNNDDLVKIDEVINDYKLRIETTYINNHYGELFKILYGEDYINQSYFKKYLVKDEKENKDE